MAEPDGELPFQAGDIFIKALGTDGELRFQPVVGDRGLGGRRLARKPGEARQIRRPEMNRTRIINLFQRESSFLQSPPVYADHFMTDRVVGKDEPIP